MNGLTTLTININKRQRLGEVVNRARIWLQILCVVEDLIPSKLS